MKFIKISQNSAVIAFYERIAPKIKWRHAGQWQRNMNGFYKELNGYILDRYQYVATIIVSNSEIQLSIESAQPRRLVHKDSIKIDKDNVQNQINHLLGIRKISLQVPAPTQTGVGTPSQPIRHVNNNPVYAYERLTRIHSRANPASVLELFIWKRKMGYVTMYIVTNLEGGSRSEAKPIQNSSNSVTYPFQEAVELLKMYVDRSIKTRNFMDSSSKMYIPEGADSGNFNFVTNTWRNKPEGAMAKPVLAKPEEDIESLNGDVPGDVPAEQSSPRIPRRPDLTHLMAQKTQNDFEGYFDQEVPDWAVDMMGTGNVDASQISGMFGRTNDAIQLVNKYSSGILNNVSFIFNFAKSGAYGVYVPALDRAIKTKALKRQLESDGYVVKDEGGILAAYSKDKNVPSESVQKDIDKLWSELNQQGGSALGINMNNVINASIQDATSIERNIVSEGGQLSDRQLLQDMVTLIHLSSTIVHEAIHAKGGDESAAYGGQDEFIAKILGEINNRYQRELQSKGLENEFTPIEPSGSKRMASNVSWYKVAQYMSNIPKSLLSGPTGSDLSGRYGNQLSEEGVADWGMIAQQDQSTPIEKRLGREYMAPLSPDVDQMNDVIEKQLRKQFRNDSKPNPKLIYEELLRKDHTDQASYKLVEEQMEEQRPSPLILPLKKAGKINKQATLFGWYNNLEISDGNTIPGLGDRVMAWDDRDEDFAWDEDTTRKQYRYNPEYDSKGFHFRWIEPHFAPQLFDDMTGEYPSNTHPAKRFAATDGLTEVMTVLNNINSALGNGIRATRLVVSEDLIPLVTKVIDGRIFAFPAEEDNGQKVVSLWICDDTISEDEINAIEKFSTDRTYNQEIDSVITSVLGVNEQMGRACTKVINVSKQVCESWGYTGLFVIGAYARLKVESDNPSVPELNFVCDHPNRCIKIGEEVAERLGVECRLHNRSGRLSFVFGNIMVDFGGSKGLGEISKKINSDSAVKISLANFDFTVNMLSYNVCSGEVEDVFNQSFADLEGKIVKTYLDPEFVVQNNPMVILNALRFELDGWEVDKELKRAMIENANLLLDGRYPVSQLIHARENLRCKGNDIDSKFDQYALWKIKKL